VTALSSLSVCPLQFFWRSQLNLNAWRPLAESEGAAEGGTWLHRVAEAVPRRLQEPNPPSTAEEWRSFLLDTLHTLLPGEETDLVFWTSLQQRLTSLAQWLANPSLPLPLRAEAVLEGQLPLSQARLRGRADWLIPQGVIDLKTTRPDELKRKIQLQHLDLQLQAYAWMLEPAEPQTTDYTLAFLSVQSDEVVSVPTPSQPDLLRTVDEALARIQQGEPIRALEALGSGEGCEQCPARGACRPEEWLA
jgi:ATP-dependent helicase/nuclease subunit B